MTQISNEFPTSQISNALYLKRETARDREMFQTSETVGNESGSTLLIKQNIFSVKVCWSWFATANTGVPSPNKAAEENNRSSLVKVP